MGAVIGISIFNGQLLDVSSKMDLSPTLIISTGLLVLPLLAFLIDLKIVEIGMQLKLISNHLSEKYFEFEQIREWEENLWRKNSIASTRTKLSLTLYVGASTVILVLCFLTVGILRPEWVIYLIPTGIILIALPVIAMFTLIPKLLGPPSEVMVTEEK